MRDCADQPPGLGFRISSDFQHSHSRNHPFAPFCLRIQPPLGQICVQEFKSAVIELLSTPAPDTAPILLTEELPLE